MLDNTNREQADSSGAATRRSCCAAFRSGKFWAAGLAALFGIAVVVWLCIPAEPEPVYQSRTLMAWARDLDHPDLLVRSNAVAALRAIGTNAIPPLVRALHERDPLWRRPYESAAVPRLSRRARAWFFQTFRPFDAAVDRHAALRGLMLFGTNAPAPELARMLKDPEKQNASLAAEALGEMGPIAVPGLVRALRDPDGHVRSIACYALSRIGTDAAPAVRGLIERFTDTETNVTLQAVYVLSRVGKAAVPELIKALRQPEDRPRLLAIQSLAMIGREAREATAGLVEMTRDRNPVVRLQAVQALGQVGPAAPQALSALTTALWDEEAGVRARAAAALSQAGRQARPAVPALVECLQDVDAVVRSNVLEALKRIDPNAAAPALAE